MSDQAHRVVIIGGGFAGLTLALKLKRVPVQVTLLDRRNHHLFQPLLYQVATGGLSPANIASPLRSVLRNCPNVKVLLGEAVEFDIAGRRVHLADGDQVPYDTLVVATGVTHQYFGHPEWEKLAPGLKSLDDATELRRRILLAFEAAERETDPKRREAWLTFIVVGAGPTGVEMSGAIGELSHFTMRNNFRNFDPNQTRVLLLECADRVLTTFPPTLSAKTQQGLEELGVTVRTNTILTDLQPDHVVLKMGDKTETVATRTVVWAAGVQASPLGARIAKAAGSEVDRAGRPVVELDLSLRGHPEIFVIGDLANYSHDEENKPLPGVAPAAIQEANFIAKLINARISGQAPPTFKYFDKGSMATIGRGRAVAFTKWMKFSGFLGWCGWLFVHILYIVAFESRVLILIQWFTNYITRSRSSRLITGQDSLKLLTEEKAAANAKAALPAPASTDSKPATTS